MNIPWWLSLIGALGCFGCMFPINPLAGISAICIEFAIWAVLKRRGRTSSWGNVWRDVYEALVRWTLLRLERHPVTARSWRPHILVFVGDVERRLDLARYATWFSENRGVVTVCEMQVGNLLSLKRDTEARQKEVNAILRQAGIPAFGEVNVVNSIERGIISVAQGHGLAGMECNTILVGGPDAGERLVAFLKVIRSLHRLNKLMLIGHVHDLPPLRQGKRRVVHIWWGGLQRNGDLMLLLSYLLTRNLEWRNAEIRVLSIASNAHMQRQTVLFLEQLVAEIRIEAEISVMLRPEVGGSRTC